MRIDDDDVGGAGQPASITTLIGFFGLTLAAAAAPIWLWMFPG